jgi:transposase
VLEAVLWILNTGAQWHMLPQSYPNYKTVHRRFQTWRGDAKRLRPHATAYRRDKLENVTEVLAFSQLSGSAI